MQHCVGRNQRMPSARNGPCARAPGRRQRGHAAGPGLTPGTAPAQQRGAGLRSASGRRHSAFPCSWERPKTTSRTAKILPAFARAAVPGTASASSTQASWKHDALAGKARHGCRAPDPAARRLGRIPGAGSARMPWARAATWRQAPRRTTPTPPSARCRTWRPTSPTSPR